MTLHSAFTFTFTLTLPLTPRLGRTSPRTRLTTTREDLREQHAIGEEIAEALTQGVIGSGVDEDELDEELAELQQEELDNKMLKTGTVPVHDQVQRLPGVATGECERSPCTRRLRTCGPGLMLM